MVDQAKRMTVSFGAFSCTLDGFDDPFPMMKRIVEYFQEVSKTDPNFGLQAAFDAPVALSEIMRNDAGEDVTAAFEGSDLVISAGAGAVAAATGQDVDTASGAAGDELVATDTLWDDYAVLSDDVEDAAQADAGDEPAQAGEDVSALTDSDSMAETDGEMSVAVDGDTSAQVDGDTSVELDGETSAEADGATISQADRDSDMTGDVNAGFAQDLERDQSNNWAQNLASDDLGDADAEDQAAPLELNGHDALRDEDANDHDDDLALGDLTNDVSADAPVADVDATAAQDLADNLDGDVAVAAPIAPLMLSDPIQVVDAPGENFSTDVEPSVEDTAAARMVQAELETPLDAPAATQDNPSVSGLEKMTPNKSGFRLGFGGAPGLDASDDERIKTTDNVQEQAYDTGIETGVFSEDGVRFTFEEEEARANALADGMSQAEAPSDAGLVKPQPLVLDTHSVVTDPSPQIETNTDVPVLQLVDPITPSADRPNVVVPDGSMKSIREFASSAGAATLPELLEASAAYVTMVSGRRTFSRNELMTMMDEVPAGSDYSQEARIRTFSTMVNGGRIENEGDGKYTLSSEARAFYEKAVSG